MKQSGFNPQARWDRHTPETGSSPEPEGLEEVIEVLALFKGGQILPQQFTWKGKPYDISRITYHWKEHQGHGLISFFTVSTGCDLYQLSFNNMSFGWRLEKVIS